ncbi:DNA polymerase III subunit alpha [candidate division WOR-3 bacterium]|nr:DNA polymerase III subunit alpha [candidate division WOR-3 bacterium]
MNSLYTPFFYHSNYGFGGSDFKTLFEYLNKYNLKSCGIIDQTFFGLPEFVKYAKNYNIKPIIGTRISLALSPLPHLSLRGSLREPKQSRKITTPAKFCGGLVPRPFTKERGVVAPFMMRRYLYLFAKNRQGYVNLCHILTANAFKNIELDFIKEHSAGLVLVSSSVELLKKLSPAFTEKYYLLLPHHTTLTKEFPPVAANEIFYVTKGEKNLYKLMCAIKNHKYEYKKGVPNHLLTNKEFNKIFTDYPQAIINNRKLSEICNFAPENRGWIFPKSKQNLYDIIKPKIKNLTHHERLRIQYECRIIKNTGFGPYFSLVYHLKEFALSKGIGMNVRGSAASSFILYVLGLSIANPLKYNLPFERFLNPGRSEPPDIDIDVEFNKRENLIQEIFKKFGKDYVAHISAINRFQRRARFRNTARAYGISSQELKNIKNHTGENLIKNIHNISEQIDNYPHYFSCHASGIVIIPEPICNFVPLYPNPAGQITQFDKDGIEMVGMVKIDILGVRGFPSLYLSREKINFKDQKVYKFISEGKTLGCFQIESPMVRQFLKRIKPKTLMDIANAIAIIRPGPAQGGMKEKFLKRLKNEEKIEYPHPILKNALKHTLGIPIYQEQILQIAHDFAKFSLSDGDILRRAMTKERNSNRMKKLEKLFFSKAKKSGYNKKEIENVWERIQSFSSFGFNKAHSITYAALAYLSAYQKFYNPSEFFCRLINNKGGYYPTYAYINEARRWGIKFIAPDVNKSDIGFSVINKTNNTVRAKSTTSLITGLSEIKNLSIKTIKRILKFRPFKNGQDFFFRVQPSIDEGISLIKSGALDTFNHTWPELYFILLNSKLKKLSRPFAKGRGVTEKIPCLQDFNQQTKFQEQLSIIDFLPQCHIIEILYPERKIKIADLVVDKKTIITGTPIAQRTIRTKNNKLMSFLTIDDETGTLEVVIFPDKYKPNSVNSIMQIEGVIKDDSLIADNYTNLLITEKH